MEVLTNSITVDCKNQRHCGNSENDENNVISGEFRQWNVEGYCLIWSVVGLCLYLTTELNKWEKEKEEKKGKY